MQNAQALVLETVNGLIEENEIEKALDTLKDLDKQTGADIWQDLTLQYSNLRSAAKAQREGRIAFEEFRRYEAQAKYALTELMKEIPRKVALNAKIRGVGAFQFDVPDEPTLEKVLGPINHLVRIDWLDKARAAANAVCRVVCEDGNLGTGFLTKEGYVFTNNHVIGSAEVAKTARIEFNFEEGKTRTAYQIDASDFITSPQTDLDFTRVKVIDRADAPLSQWGFVEFDPDAVPSLNEPVTLIQHPEGEVKQIALTSNEVVGQLKQYLFYKTDTKRGSSGSPIFNNNWKVVAIHHAGLKLEEGGYIINAKGEKAGANQGILFRDIFAHINK